MSSLRTLLGTSLQTTVRNGGGLGLLISRTTRQKCWLSSYTLSKQFHSYYHYRSTLPSSLLEARSRNILEHDQKSSAFQLSAAGNHSSASRNRNETRIDESLNRLDVEIRRVGRIRRQEVDDIFEDIKDLKKATSSQSLMMIRCCGELIPEEPPSSRTELVQQIWKTLENLNVPMDVSHYNALLRVYLENEHTFNPTEFLQDLTNKGIEPNRVTYQRLIARFCQDGDIDGASTILEHMKEKQMPINEYVFNALVLGHGQANDMESAEGILAVMKQAGLEPNDDTYVTLMTCYAKHGDVSNVHRIVKECEEKEIFLIDRDFMNVIHALAANNHTQLIDEILPYLKKQSGFNQEATNLIFKLMNIGQEEVAFKILKVMTPLIRSDGNASASGNFFIKHLVHLSRPSETIVKFCKALQDEELHKFAFSRACEFALMSKKFELAVELLEAAQQHGLPIRQHYFWPLFASATSERDIRFGLKCMNDLGHTPSTETLREYIIPYLLEKDKEPVERSLQKLSNVTGIQLSTIVSAAMMHLLSKNELGLASNFSTQYRLRLGNPVLRRAIVDAYFRTRDAESFAKIIGSSSIDGDDQARETVGMMLMELVDSIRSHERKSEFLEPVLQQLHVNGLGLSNSGSELLQNNLGEGLTPALANRISQLTSSELTPKISMSQDTLRRGNDAYVALDEKSSEELERMLAEAIKKGSPTKGIRKSMLYSYCRDRNVEKVDKLKEELDKESFVYTPGLYAMFLDLYGSVGRLEEAKACYKELTSNLDMKMDDLKILRFALALQSSGDVDECINVLKTAPREESRKPSGGAQQVTVWNLLNSLADSGPEKVKEVFDILNERKLTAVNNVTLGPLVKAHLVKEDLEGALQEFERCVKEYRVTPWKNELFCRFIKLEDADRLQKVMDLSTTIHGEVNSMYDLVFAFIDCGKIRQAKKILETPGLRARNDKIEMFCQRYCQENRIAELENLIQVTRDLIDVDRNTMYFYLLQAYCKSGDTDKALSVWTTMQEENVQPSVELLIYLADFLRKNNCSVPFVIPDPSEMMTSAISSQMSSTETDLKVGLPKSLSEYRRCIDMNEIDRALQIKQRMEADGTSLNLTDTSNLIERFARAERLNEATRLVEQLFEKDAYPLPRSLKYLVDRLASAGDVNALERMNERLTLDTKKTVLFNSRLTQAYVNAGRGEEYFENQIKKTVESAIGANEGNTGSSQREEEASGNQEGDGSIPVSGLITILKKNEHLVTEVENLSNRAEGLHRRALKNALYAYFMSKKEYSRAKEIWDTSLKSETRILFRSIVQEARNHNDVETARAVTLDVLSAKHISNSAKGVACCGLLDVLSVTGQLDEALKFLNESLKILTLEDYPVSVLTKLKNAALDANKEFPHVIPQGRRRRRDQSSDSSDSD